MKGTTKNKKAVLLMPGAIKTLEQKNKNSKYVINIFKKIKDISHLKTELRYYQLGIKCKNDS